MITAKDITVVSYVQRKDGGKIRFDAFAASEMRYTYLSALLAGKAILKKGEKDEA